ncbi:MAG TPA: hypothetical protein VHN74_03695 [Candidatus Angelobacter sp.]|jgi:hypothetical protein|nr:hypothetical protein [Candidatus Angelobacter sp.]
MPEISTVKAPITKAAPKKDKLWGAIFAGARTMVIAIAKTGYALWLEITGLLCALLAFRYASGLFKEYHANHFADHKRALTFAVFTVVFTYFTILSFVKSKRMRK